MPRRAKFGDIVEIKTSKGLAYALYTHSHMKPPRYGYVIRVFDRLFQSRPTDLRELLEVPIRFTTFFPLGAALNRGILEVVGNVPIPQNLKSFPLFRSGNEDLRTGKVDQWWLWDGEKSWKIGNLTPEQRKLPIKGTWNATLLIRRIEDGWRPEDDPR